MGGREGKSQERGLWSPRTSRGNNLARVAVQAEGVVVSRPLWGGAVGRALWWEWGPL